LRSFSEPRVAQFIFFFPDQPSWLFMQLSISKIRIGGRKTKYPQPLKGGGPVAGKPGTCNSPFRGLGGFNYLRTELCTTYFAACCFAFRPNRSIISQ
jgi:hypothetical protein